MFDPTLKRKLVKTRIHMIDMARYINGFRFINFIQLKPLRIHRSFNQVVLLVTYPLSIGFAQVCREQPFIESPDKRTFANLVKAVQKGKVGRTFSPLVSPLQAERIKSRALIDI